MAHNRDTSLRLVGRPKGFFAGLTSAVREVSANRDLLKLLISREVKSRYKNSSLGIVWSLLKPATQLAVYYIFIGKFLGAARAIPDFAIFVFAGLTIWSLFSELVQGGTDSILSNQGLVKKIYLPRELFPLAAAGSALFNFFVQLIVLLTATVVFGVAPLSTNFLLLIPSVLLVIVFGLAIGLFLSALNVYLRDTEHLVSVLLMLGFWASPIVYSLRFVHDALQGNWLEQIYLLNPVTLAVVGIQRATWISGVNDPSQFWPQSLELRLLGAILVSFVLLIISQRIFSRLQGNFAQEL